MPPPSALILALVLSTMGAPYSCPGSPAFMHASCRVTAEASASCDTVKAEVIARVKGQPDTWHDPHNNGTYTVTAVSSGEVALQRRTGNDKYTDKMLLELRPTSGSSCSISACSESQVFSIADFSTNYCNLRMLYCGKADGCHPVGKGFEVAEIEVVPSMGAGTNKADCLKV